MNRFSFSTKFLVAATLATAALSAATVAEAHPEVFVSIGLQGGQGWEEPTRGYFQPQPVYVQPQPVYGQPRPVYVQPRPVYFEPAPVYLRPPVFVSPREGFEHPGWRGDEARFDWERERAWHRAEWRHEERQEFRGGDRGYHGNRGDQGDRERHRDQRD